MNRVAIVVQRCHHTVVGGSESLAWQYATLLRDKYDIDVLTTTAVDTSDWANALPAGREEKEGVNIVRFPVTVGRNAYFAQLHQRLTHGFDVFAPGRQRKSDQSLRLSWNVPLQEEFILNQGPYSEPLMQFIKQNWPDYHAIIFITYLYPTTYFGLQQVPRGHALFAPTLHDEQTAYLSAYKHAAHRAQELLWLTDAERRVGHKLWGELPGRVVAMPVDTETRASKLNDADPYLLYCGRIDPNKGSFLMFDYFLKFIRSTSASLRLVLTGIDDVEVPEHPRIEFRGFVSNAEKLRLMAGATAYLVPSPNESFSIVTLEAMAQETPVLAYGGSEVLVDHIRNSGAGRIYNDSESFNLHLGEMLADDNLCRKMGVAGREYVVTNFKHEAIRDRLIGAIETSARNRSAHSRVAEFSYGPTPTTPGGPAPRGLVKSPPLPLPAGWTEDELRELITSVQVENGPPDELRMYATGDFRRFVYTLGLVSEKPGLKILELGANPYFTTTLLSKFRRAEIHLANFFGDKGEGSQNVTIGKTGEVISYHYQQFNIEEDAFPYPNDSFDVVLFCEIIEHLLSDPVHALIEIRRVLKPGGELVLTTPNVARLENIRKIIGGENVYDPYSGYGPYGRHNREYTQSDLTKLLSENGFAVTTMFTADVLTNAVAAGAALDAVVPVLKERAVDLGQYIFCRCKVHSESKNLAPIRADWLYRSRHSEE
jgi:glycosyltransferase involved in cell wall biosynthesis/SAM-dependent methyltransferase